MNVPRNILSYKNVSLKREENEIINNASLELNAGEFIYLIGDVGSGKSTLLKSIYADVPISSGKAQFLDFNLAEIKRKQIPLLRRKLGIVFQDFQLLVDRTVIGNLQFVLKATGWKDKKEIDKRIQKVLDTVNMAHKGYKMPHELSGGEQQRVVIARSLLNNPELILADEPTGNLDPGTSDQIICILKDISKRGTAVIVATHNYNLLKKYPARILRVKDQRLEEVEILQ